MICCYVALLLVCVATATLNNDDCSSIIKGEFKDKYPTISKKIQAQLDPRQLSLSITLVQEESKNEYVSATSVVVCYPPGKSNELNLIYHDGRLIVERGNTYGSDILTPYKLIIIAYISPISQQPGPRRLKNGNIN